MAYCLPPGNDISAVELVRLANEYGMYFSSGDGAPRLSHMKTASGVGVYTGIVDSAPYPRENNGVAQISRHHGISEWSTNNRTISMLIRAHCYGNYVPKTREEYGPMGDPRFCVGLGIYYGDTQVSGMYDIHYGSDDVENYSWDIGQRNDYLEGTPQIDGYHSQYLVSYVDEYDLGPGDSETIYARFRVAPASVNYLMDEDFSEFYVNLSVLYMVQ
jgi:hypothetical protein